MNQASKQVFEDIPLQRSGSTRDPHHFAFVDALRGYAIMAVVMIHCGLMVPYLPARLRTFTDSGGFGVQLFFVISAFTLFWSLRSRYQIDRCPLKAFFVRRIFRVGPLFWIAMIFYLWHPSHWRPEFAPNGIGWPHILLTATLTHEWYPTTINSVVPGGWSIGTEAMFYLCIPFLHINIKSARSAIWVVVLSCLVISVLMPFAHHYLAQRFPDSQKALIDDFLFWWFPSQLPVFCLGFVLYFVLMAEMSREAFSIGSTRNTSVLLLVIGCVVMLGCLPRQVVYAIGFVFVSWGLAIHHSPFLVNRVIRFVGMVSYSVYIWHTVILEIVAPRLIQIIHPSSRIGINGSIQLIGVYISVLLLAVVAATVSYYAVELPSQKVGKTLISRLKWGAPQH